MAKGSVKTKKAKTKKPKMAKRRSVRTPIASKQDDKRHITVDYNLVTAGPTKKSTRKGKVKSKSGNRSVIQEQINTYTEARDQVDKFNNERSWLILQSKIEALQEIVPKIKDVKPQ